MERESHNLQPELHNSELDRDEQQLRPVLDAWRQSLHNSADRPGWFWARQRARLSSEVSQQNVTRIPRLVWAGLAAVIATAILLFTPAHPVKPVEPTPAAKVEISDHDLMVALERTMNGGVPSSLAPAGLLAQEMNQALEANVQSKSKEKQYEE